jgi:epoxyqueuosine reductase QueG
MGLNDEIITLLNHKGCDIVGFADLRILPAHARDDYDFGISIGLVYSKQAMEDSRAGCPRQYYNEYSVMVQRLPQLGALVADFLTQKGYRASASPSPSNVDRRDLTTVLPHKTVATVSGLGWIGKCANLVTSRAGSALRFTAVVTDAPVNCGILITISKCPPNCMVCADVCPGKAVSGKNWEIGLGRDSFYNAHACNTAARARAKAMLGVDYAVCGLCIAHCPYTVSGLAIAKNSKEL